MDYMKSRTQKDSLGEVEVAINAKYGAQTQRAMDNFDYAKQTLPELFVKTLLVIKKCAAITNAELEQISHDKSAAIRSSCDKLLAHFEPSDFPVSVYQTGSGTSTNMNVNEVIAFAASSENASTKVHPNDDVNYGQSSNDVIPSAVQLALATQIKNELIPSLDQAIQTIDRLSEQYKKVLKTGRTHLMDAMPISLGSEFATWAFQLSESKTRLLESLNRLYQIPLGGTAVGTGINRHADYPTMVAQYLSKELSMPIEICDNLSARMTSLDSVAEIHSDLKILATTMVKLSNDMRWMNSGPNHGLKELSLAALQPGSSIMPSKVNPVIFESVLMMATKVIGNDVTLSLANQSGNFQLNVMMPLIADVALESAQLITSCSTALANKAFANMIVNKDYLVQQVEKNPMLVTALNREIGYEKAAHIAKIAQKQGRSIVDVADEESNVERDKLLKLLDPMQVAFPFGP